MSCFVSVDSGLVSPIGVWITTHCLQKPISPELYVKPEIIHTPVKFNFFSCLYSSSPHNLIGIGR